jgi:hypothetical protein
MPPTPKNSSGVAETSRSRTYFNTCMRQPKCKLTACSCSDGAMLAKILNSLITRRSFKHAAEWRVTSPYGTPTRADSCSTSAMCCSYPPWSADVRDVLQLSALVGVPCGDVTRHSAACLNDRRVMRKFKSLASIAPSEHEQELKYVLERDVSVTPE